MKSKITKYTKISAISGEPAEEAHHLIWGDMGAKRKKADQDELILPVTHDEHTGGELSKRIHDNSMAESLSKIAGQLGYEKEYYRQQVEPGSEDPAREAFIKRYGKSYL